MVGVVVVMMVSYASDGCGLRESGVRVRVSSGMVVMVRGGHAL